MFRDNTAPQVVTRILRRGPTIIPCLGFVWGGKPLVNVSGTRRQGTLAARIQISCNDATNLTTRL